MCLYIHIGTGIGGALVFDGKVFDGYSLMQETSVIIQTEWGGSIRLRMWEAWLF